MKRAQLIGAFLSCVGLVAGCNSRQQADHTQDKNIVDLDSKNAVDREARVVTVEGCVTASGDKFMLTRLQSDPTATTETYQLVNANDQLRSMVGREVRVSGESAPPLIAESRESSPTEPVGTSGQEKPSARDGANENARVQTQQTTRLEVSTLRVSSVTATGGDCPAPSQQSR